MAEETHVLVELTQYSLHALRAVNGTVEAGGECALENKVALEALLDSVAPSRKADGMKAVATVWPASVSWYISTDTEAMLDRTADSLRAIAGGKQKDPRAAIAYAACNADDGGIVTAEGTEKWVLAHCALAGLEKASMGILELKVDPLDVTPTAFSGIGAVVSGLRLEGKGGAVALWDLGAESSTLILVTASGVMGTVTCAVGMDAIIEAVQTALKLKFRGAGARLFFNDAYDFSDPGPRIASLLGPLLKEAIGHLPATPAPPALACLSLTGKQSWFIREVAAAAGISHWQPDLAKLAADLGIKFAEGAESSFSSASCGLLGLLGGKIHSRDSWNPAWVEAEGQAEEAETAPAPAPEPEPEPEPDPEPAPRPAPVPVRMKPAMSIDTSTTSAPRPPKPVVTPRSVSAPPLPVPSQPPDQRPPAPPAPTRSPIPPPDPVPSHTAPVYTAPAPSFSAAPPAVSPPTLSFPPAAPSFAAQAAAPRPAPPPTPAPSAFPAPPARPPSFSNPGFPVPEIAPERTAPAAPAAPASPPPVPTGLGTRMGVPSTPSPAARAVTSLPFEAVKPKAGAPASAPPDLPPEEDAEEAPTRKSKVGFYIAVGVVASLLAAAIAVVLEAHKAKTDAYDLEQQEQLAHHNADLLLKEQEQKAKDDADRARKEMEAQIAATKKQAEEDTRRAVLAEIEADRLAKLPGSLILATVPAGASVSIDGGAPLLSPVKAEGMAPGTHHVQISLKGFDSVEMNSEIKGSQATDLGSLALQASYGSIDLTSTPDGLDYAVRPASDPKGNPVTTGTTPATAEDIPHGDYIVTFSRPGCRDHVENVSVKKGVKSPVDTKYVNGSLELTSEPSGATVSKDGTFLGTTPLTLHDLTPKTESFDLTLPGYDPTPVSCEIPEGQPLQYSAQLLRKDRVFKPNEVKTAPDRFDAPQPKLSPSQQKTGAEVLISLVVRRDGTVSDVQVVKSTDDDVARRCKAAVEKWKFRPATAPDDRTVDAAIEVPFKFTATSK